MASSRAIEFRGPAGRIEGILQEAGGPDPRRAALVCHPHPLGGGTMHTKVVHRTARALAGAGHHVLRFNFRGVGASEGVHDGGPGEREDARAALAHLKTLHPDLPVTLAGFSFGAWVGLSVGCEEESVDATIGIAPPANLFNFAFLMTCPKTKLFIHGTEDTVAPLAAFEPLYKEMPGPKGLVRVAGGTHLLSDHLDQVEAAVRSFARRLAAG